MAPRAVEDGLLTRLTILDAFRRNPRLGWTPSSLSSWYGIRIDVVRRLLTELVERETIRTDTGRGERYVLREKAVPRTLPGLRLAG
jgi:DNA-binding IclR family transcriptional regulator